MGVFLVEYVAERFRLFKGRVPVARGALLNKGNRMFKTFARNFCAKGTLYQKVTLASPDKGMVFSLLRSHQLCQRRLTQPVQVVCKHTLGGGARTAKIQHGQASNSWTNIPANG
eukprot:6489311-Amphidinium_carterae.2